VRARFVAREEDRFVVIDLPQVSVIEADKNYVWFTQGSQRIRARYSINDVEGNLDPQEFLRLNRSTIVQATQIHGFERNFRGRLLVILKSGKRLVCTAGYRERVLRYLGVS
jgi:two-component system LytT family response regulator